MGEHHVAVPSPMPPKMTGVLKQFITGHELLLEVISRRMPARVATITAVRAIIKDSMTPLATQLLVGSCSGFIAIGEPGLLACPQLTPSPYPCCPETEFQDSIPKKPTVVTCQPVCEIAEAGTL